MDTAGELHYKSKERFSKKGLKIEFKTTLLRPWQSGRQRESVAVKDEDKKV